MSGRPYPLDSEMECERLELQSKIAGIERHLAHLDIPDGAAVLDVGCGSGSMSRLLATRFPSTTVVGLDFMPHYVAYARARAESDGLTNLTFRQGDAQSIDLPDAAFDLLWSKYLMYFLHKPEAAIREFRRVTKPGGKVVLVLNDWRRLVFWPEDHALQADLRRVVEAVIDASLPGRLPQLLMQAGFIDVSVTLETDRVYTVAGAIDARSRQNLAAEITAARPHIAATLGEAASNAFIASYLDYFDRPDTTSVIPLWFVQGMVS